MSNDPSRRDVLKAAAGCAALALVPDFSLAAAFTPPSPSDLVLWYDKPSTKWIEAFPLGNARIGAMLHGRTDEERIELNDNTLYSGYPGSRDLKDLNISKTL